MDFANSGEENKGGDEQDIPSGKTAARDDFDMKSASDTRRETSSAKIELNDG